MKGRIKSISNKFIPVFSPRISLLDALYIFKVAKKGSISGNAPEVAAFETEMAKLCGRKFAIAVSNGTIALDFAVEALNLQPGDEVIVPAFTIVSCIHQLVLSKCSLVFVDVDPTTWNVNAETIASAISPRTKCVLIPHTYGLPADMIEIEKICQANNIYLIEDAAEAHGQSLENRQCGSFGIMSTFSFYANKHITSGEGGMILTDDPSLYEKLISMRNLGFKKNKRFEHDENYGNARMGGLQAALGLRKIKSLGQTIRIKQKQASYYDELLSLSNHILQTPASYFKSTRNHYWVYGVLLKSKGIRDQVMIELLSLGIETRPFFHPLHLQPYLKSKYSNTRLPISEDLGENGLYLPTGDQIKRHMQRQIVNALVQKVEILQSGGNNDA